MTSFLTLLLTFVLRLISILGLTFIVVIAGISLVVGCTLGALALFCVATINDFVETFAGTPLDYLNRRKQNNTP